MFACCYLNALLVADVYVEMNIGGEVDACEISGGTIFDTFITGAMKAIVNAVAAVEKYQRC